MYLNLETGLGWVLQCGDFTVSRFCSTLSQRWGLAMAGDNEECYDGPSPASQKGALESSL